MLLAGMALLATSIATGPEPGSRIPAFSLPDQTGQMVGRDPGIDHPPVSANRFVVLSQEPIQQRTVLGQLPTNNRRPQSQGVWFGHLAEVLSLTVKIFSVGGVTLFVVPAISVMTDMFSDRHGLCVLRSSSRNLMKMSQPQH